GSKTRLLSGRCGNGRHGVQRNSREDFDGPRVSGTDRGKEPDRERLLPVRRGCRLRRHFCRRETVRDRALEAAVWWESSGDSRARDFGLARGCFRFHDSRRENTRRKGRSKKKKRSSLLYPGGPDGKSALARGMNRACEKPRHLPIVCVSQPALEG